MEANVDTAPMCPRVSLSSRVIVLVTMMLLTTGLGCTVVEEEHLLTPEAEYRLTLNLRSMQINDVLHENDGPSGDPLVRDPFRYLFLRGDPERTYIVATHAFPGAEVHGVFEGNTLTIDIDGQHVELTSHIPMLGADPVPAYVRVDTPLGKSNFMWVVHDQHDMYAEIRELLRTRNK